MMLDELVARMTAQYPTLFGHRSRALDHLFIVIGNGYAWENGRLVPVHEDPDPLPFDEWLAHQPTRLRASGLGFDRSDEAIVAAEREAAERARTPLGASRRGVAYTPYPLSENYSGACTVPEDAQPDYVLGAIEALDTHVSLAERAGDERERLKALDALATLHARFPALFYRFYPDYAPGT